AASGGRRRRIRASADLVPQLRLRDPIPVPRLRVADLGARLLELRLRELDDRGEPQLVAAAREGEGGVRLLEQLRGDLEASVGGARVQPARLDVADDLVPELQEPLARGLRPILGFLGARAEEEPVEDGDLDVDADRAVPGRDGVVAPGRTADR